ncbi:MAG: thioredoxin domain-containing protein, partial [Ruminococcus sp.]|nr:thioredoxin domain-containing protein [Ruminococcus sp.]
MAHESFEDEEVAEILNKYFISIKVDKEERPDLDSIYMTVCQAFTGSGGWPTTIFLTPEKKPFFAGTYFPKTARYGQIGLKELLMTVQKKWETDRTALMESAEEVVAQLNVESTLEGEADEKLLHQAVAHFKRIFDKSNGGFGRAPKFPSPHNLLFLMSYYEKSKDEEVMRMVELTLLQMYRGGMFDHIGGGFCRYSTDAKFLVPHFEKMLCDNALLILAYCRAYEISGKEIYQDVAQKTAAFILREMTDPEGGFYSAQDADSEGVEGKYYLFEPEEIIGILGEEAGGVFNQYFDITKNGNFEGKNIPNLLGNVIETDILDSCLPEIYEYRKNRYALHLDDKILTSWNGLMIAAMCSLYRVSKEEIYLEAAKKAQEFIFENLYEGENLYVSFRKGQRSKKGFLDDYANMIFALLALYDAVLDQTYLEKAKKLCEKAVRDFYDSKKGGFFLYGKENEQLIMRPKETYDGAVPSGNSIMAYNLVRLSLLLEEKEYRRPAKAQLDYMSAEAAHYPAGYAMFLNVLSDYFELPEKITVVLKDRQDIEKLSLQIPLGTVVKILEGPTEEFPLKNDRTTFYVCRGRSCLPPVNTL